MKHFPYTIAGNETMTYVPETRDDMRQFRAFVDRQAAKGAMTGADTESTGLDTFSPTYGLRTVQLGDAREAYVLQTEGRPEMQEDAREALRRLRGSSSTTRHSTFWSWISTSGCRWRPWPRR